MIAAVALIAYMIATGQLPPRMGRGDVELPSEDVSDTGVALRYLARTVREGARKLETVEAQVNELERARRGEPDA